MAYATKKYTASGVTTDTVFTTPNYISGRPQDISVTVDSSLQTKDTHYSITGTQVKFLSGYVPADNKIIKITRNSNQSARLTDYQDGSSLNADTLDADANQLFFVAQEALDTASETNLNVQTFYSSGTSAPTSPDVGDLWYDTNTGVNKIKVYSGSAWVDAFPVISRNLYDLSDEVATATDKSANKLVFPVGSTNVNNVHVYLNGVKLKEGSSDDYLLDSTAGNGATYGSNNVIKVNNLWDSSGGTFASGFSGTDDIEILAFTATEENETTLKYGGAIKVEATTTGATVTGDVNTDGVNLTAGTNKQATIETKVESDQATTFNFISRGAPWHWVLYDGDGSTYGTDGNNTYGAGYHSLMRLTDSDTIGSGVGQLTLDGSLSADTIKTNNGVEASPVSVVVSTNTVPTVEVNKKYINTYSSGVNAYTLPTGTEGQMITFVNASTQNITLARNTNSITISKVIAGNDPANVTDNTITVGKSGTVEVVYTGTNTAVIFGSGLS